MSYINFMSLQCYSGEHCTTLYYYYMVTISVNCRNGLWFCNNKPRTDDQWDLAITLSVDWSAQNWKNCTITNGAPLLDHSFSLFDWKQIYWNENIFGKYSKPRPYSLKSSKRQREWERKKPYPFEPWLPFERFGINGAASTFDAHVTHTALDATKTGFEITSHNINRCTSIDRHRQCWLTIMSNIVWLQSFEKFRKFSTNHSSIWKKNKTFEQLHRINDEYDFEGTQIAVVITEGATQFSQFKCQVK